MLALRASVLTKIGATGIVRCKGSPNLPCIAQVGLEGVRENGDWGGNTSDHVRRFRSAAPWCGRSQCERPPARCRRPLTLPRRRSAQRLVEPTHQQRPERRPTQHVGASHICPQTMLKAAAWPGGRSAACSGGAGAAASPTRATAAEASGLPATPETGQSAWRAACARSRMVPAHRRQESAGSAGSTQDLADGGRDKQALCSITSCPPGVAPQS